MPFFSNMIALATVRARPVSHAGDPVLWDLVEALAERAHLPMPVVFMTHPPTQERVRRLMAM